MRPRAVLLVVALALAGSIGLKASGAADQPPRTPAAAADAPVRSGEEVFKAACITCHGAHGQGNPKSHVGFDTPVPDFTDCPATTPEVEHDWFSVVYNGGPIRAFDRHMPAFGEALSEQEIWNVVGYIRTFCTDSRWPLGELNLPRPLATEKAFPENEAVVTTSLSRVGGAASSTEIAYEHRLGARTQWEIAVPIELQHPEGSGWARGLGDVAFAIKHVVVNTRKNIFSAGLEAALPTGKETQGLGSGVTTFEPFVAYGQILPGNAFVQAHAGVGLPTDREKAARETFVRVAAGRTFYVNRFGRQYSPMLELLGSKELADGEHMQWDLMPEAQVSLSKLQHVRLGVGLQVPVNEREGRGRTFHLYVLWDWFDGPLFSGW
jgi:mono/diheme cytochrome c family protein